VLRPSRQELSRVQLWIFVGKYEAFMRSRRSRLAGTIQQSGAMYWYWRTGFCEFSLRETNKVAGIKFKDPRECDLKEYTWQGYCFWIDLRVVIQNRWTASCRFCECSQDKSKAMHLEWMPSEQIGGRSRPGPWKRQLTSRVDFFWRYYLYTWPVSKILAFLP
jgi:hypothetical protein